MGSSNQQDVSPRSNHRYDFEVPMIMEFGNGFLRTPDRVDAVLVDLSQGGAAILCPPDGRIRERKRYRVWVDDHAGIIEIRNIVPINDEWVRLGVAFKGLGLELQELVADTLQNAQFRSSRMPAPGTHGVAYATVHEAEAMQDGNESDAA